MDNRDGLENQLYKADWLKEVLQTGRIGMWIVEVDNETGEFRMYPDEQMHVLLGTEHMELTPKEQFAFFQERIEPGYEKAVQDYTDRMLKTGELAEVEYYWNHPQMGKIFVRCSGKVYEREGQIYRIRGYHQDITELVRLRKTNLVQGQQLKETERQKQRYNNLFQSVLCGIIQYSMMDNGLARFKNANKEAIRILGYEEQEFWEKQEWDLTSTVCEEDRERIIKGIDELKEAGDKFFYEYRVKCRDGRKCWVIGSAELIRDLDDELVVQSVFLDINRRKEIEQKNRLLEKQLEAGNEFLRLSLEHTSIYEFYCDPVSGIGTLPERTREFYGRETPVCINMAETFAREYAAPEYHDAFLQMFRAIDRGERTATGEFMDQDRKNWRRITLSVLRYDSTGKPGYVVGITEDITKEKEMEIALRKARTQDPLTGLYTREAGIALVKERLEHKRADQVCGLMLLDMDNFQKINDVSGSVFADVLLQETADVLRRETKDEDILIRLGGDEFMVFVENCTKAEAVVQGKAIAERIRGLFPDMEGESGISASIGMCVTSVVEDYSGLYRCAESTLQYLKKNGKGRAACYLDTSNELGSWLTSLYPDELLINSVGSSNLSADEELTTFALELLGKARNISDAMNLLLVRIGKRMKLDRVCISEVNHEYRNVSCIYQWADKAVGYHETEPFYLSREDLEHILSVYSADGTSTEKLIFHQHMMPSVLHAAFWNEGTYAGAFCWEKKEEGYEWTDEEKRLIKELARIISSFTMKARADAVSQAKTDFLSRMSHEIRTPMNAIMGMTAIAKTVLEDKEKMAECLHKIETANTYLLQLINDILDMSRIESGKVELNIQRNDLHEIINSLKILIEPQAEAKGIIFSTEVSCEEKRPIMADDLRLNQILINILGNAVKFTPPGGHVTLRVEQTDADEELLRLRFSVTDDGIGIQKERQKSIFNAFEQAEASTASQYGGTGLGLSISSRLVQMMGGKLEVESEPGKGSCFYFTLSMPFAGERGGDAGMEKSAAAADFSGKRILVVEDNDINREIAVTLLEGWGFKAEEAVNGKEAVEKFLDAPPHYYDGILMDIKMPVMDGLQATRFIRMSEKEDSVSIPIIAMSANAFSEDMKKSMESGMNGHLVKPIEVEKTRKLLQKCIK